MKLSPALSALVPEKSTTKATSIKFIIIALLVLPPYHQSCHGYHLPVKTTTWSRTRTMAATSEKNIHFENDCESSVAFVIGGLQNDQRCQRSRLSRRKRRGYAATELHMHQLQQQPGDALLEEAIRSWALPRGIQFTGVTNRKSRSMSSTVSSSSSPSLLHTALTAVMPDGGLSPCVIKVVGVGGGGSNAVDRMMDTRVGGVEFWAVNTDAQALGRSRAKGAQVLNIGGSVTRGLGAGGNPEVGRMAAEESRSDISAMVQGTDLCFVTSGMGGGTGSGAAPVVAEIAKESGALTVGIVTKPFLFEGARRMKQATDAIERLKQHVDTVIVVSNNKLLEIIPENTPIERSFAVADDILRQGVVGISEIIIKPGLVNVDFADVRSVMHDAGTALMGIGTGVGKTRAEDAAAAAISSPLLDEPLNQATGIVFNISGGSDMTLVEINKAAELIYASVEEEANVIFGALIDDDMGDEMSITVLATGFALKADESKTSVGRRSSVSSASDTSRKIPASSGRVVSSPTRPVRRNKAAPVMDVSKSTNQKTTDDDIPDFLKGLKRRR